jgi:peptide/nickel transport system substrate-binding protein
MVMRNDQDLVTVVQNTNQLAPVGPQTAQSHRANSAGELDLQDFEKQMVADLVAFSGTDDAAKRSE